MQPRVLKSYVFAKTSLKNLNFPWVTKIEKYAFGGAKLRSLKVENC